MLNMVIGAFLALAFFGLPLAIIGLFIASTRFSSDTVADDWHHRISPKKIITLAMKHALEKGIAEGRAFFFASRHRQPFATCGGRLARSAEGFEAAGFSYRGGRASLS